MRLFQSLLAAAIAIVLGGPPADSAELVMFRRAGCPWCQAWDREIGPIYGKTDIGRRLPLRQVDLDGVQPAILLKRPVIYTPTFVLVEHDREAGRIEGYPGDSFFWELLERLAQQLPSQSRDDRRTVQPALAQTFR